MTGGMGRAIERTPTGVMGLDEIIEGGLIRGDVILVAGHPGTGKTTLGLQFIYYGARELGEPGVYISVTEPVQRIRRNALRFGWDLAALEDEGLVKLVDLPLMDIPYLVALETGQVQGINDVVYKIVRPLREVKAKRVVVDTISALLSLCKGEGDARLLLLRLYKELMMSKATSLLLAEIPLGTHEVRFTAQEFVVDGVIILESVLEGNRLIRRLYIPKMRGTNHSLDCYNLYITEEGIAISPMPAIRGI